MPAFGSNGLVNLNQQTVKETWQIVRPDGTVLMTCNNEAQANAHRTSLSQSLKMELQVQKHELRCL